MNPIPCRAQCRAKNVLCGIAAVLFLAASASVAAQQASASLRVSVVIPPRVKVVVEAPQQLEVTAQDVARGYVEVRTPTAISVQSNGPFGVLLDVRVPRGLFTGVRIEGDTAAELSGEGGTITLQWNAPGGAGSQRLSWTYRFTLDSAVAPGRYAWPVQLAGQPAPGPS